MKHKAKKKKAIGVHTLLDVAVAADILHTIHAGAYSIILIAVAVWFVARVFLLLNFEEI